VLSCSRSLSSILVSLYHPSDNASIAFPLLCRQHQDASTCMTRLNCSSSHFLDAITIGVEYVCVDHRSEFDNLGQCLDGRTSSLIADCSTRCNTSSLVVVVVETFLSALQLFNASTQDFGQSMHSLKGKLDIACTQMECMMACYRDKVNQLCSGGYGDFYYKALRLPFESLTGDDVLNVSSTSSTSSTSSIVNLIDLILPDSCRLLTLPVDSMQSDDHIDSEGNSIFGFLKEQESLAENLTEAILFDSSDAHGRHAFIAIDVLWMILFLLICL